MGPCRQPQRSPRKGKGGPGGLRVPWPGALAVEASSRQGSSPVFTHRHRTPLPPWHQRSCELLPWASPCAEPTGDTEGLTVQGGMGEGAPSRQAPGRGVKVIVGAHRAVQVGATCPGRDCQPGTGSKSGPRCKLKDLGRVGWGLGDREGLPGRCWSGEQCPGQDLQQWAGVLPGPPLVSRGSVESQQISGSVAGGCPPGRGQGKSGPLVQKPFPLP